MDSSPRHQRLANLRRKLAALTTEVAKTEDELVAACQQIEKQRDLLRGCLVCLAGYKELGYSVEMPKDYSSSWFDPASSKTAGAE